MLRTLKQRIVLTVVATLLAAAAGLAVGLLGGQAFTIHLARLRLDEYTVQIQMARDTAAAEARAILVALNTSSLPSCSSEALAFFRSTIYESKYMKDAGEIENGKIDCSAALGSPRQPISFPRPDFTRPDGTSLYIDPDLFRVEELPATTVQQGHSFVVYNPEIVQQLETPPMHYTATTFDAATGRIGSFLGSAPGATNAILTTQGEARLGNVLYSTRCSPRYFKCVTGFVPIPVVLNSHRQLIAQATVLGGLIGGCFGCLCSFLYRRNHSMEQQLRRALVHDRLRMNYQPIVELSSGRIAGAEALVRWTDEEELDVPPDVFVRLAESRGFVNEITRLVVRHVVLEFAETLRSKPEFHISINVASSDLGDPDFLPMLAKTVDLAGVQPQSLAIEITESGTAKRSVAVEAIRQLHLRGHDVHIDDFGTGYSSLSYLKDLSVDAIKIDQSFTRAIGTDAATAKILPLILAMVQSLDLKVIVEGIETIDQARYFCNSEKPVFAQGWLFGRPVPAAEFLRLLAEDDRKLLKPENAA